MQIIKRAPPTAINGCWMVSRERARAQMRLLGFLSSEPRKSAHAMWKAVSISVATKYYIVRAHAASASGFVGRTSRTTRFLVSSGVFPIMYYTIFMILIGLQPLCDRNQNLPSCPIEYTRSICIMRRRLRDWGSAVDWCNRRIIAMP